MLTSLSISTISWSYSTPDKEDSSAESIGILALDKALKLFYSVTNPDAGEKRECSINVPLVYVTLNHGGVRPYFTCPDCYRRVLKLYKPPPYATFSCRHCADLPTGAVRTRETTMLGLGPALGEHVVSSV